MTSIFKVFLKILSLFFYVIVLLILTDAIIFVRLQCFYDWRKIKFALKKLADRFQPIFFRFVASSVIVMHLYSNQELYNGIVEQDQNALNYLYRYLFPRVKSIVMKLGADYDTANEVFQEAIILIYRKAKSDELKEVLNIEAYIIGTCKLIWLNYNSIESKRKPEKEIVFDKIIDSQEEIVNEFQQSRRKKLYFEHFNRLGEECKKILRSFFNGSSFAEIANELNLVSEENARRRKYLCKENLVKSIKSDPQYEKLIGEYDEELFETD